MRNDDKQDDNITTMSDGVNKKMTNGVRINESDETMRRQ